ncbi:hypothetical protein VKT23_012845 [Stygiomarasmius scandens]|uniref:Uncharacterized protein n=1 Tax=Marasmiellus scandens TaxID=2682957 RepID=A0ABR1J7W3_9AGAR
MPSYTHTVKVALSYESAGEHDVRVVVRPGNLEIDDHSVDDDSLNVRVHVSRHSTSDLESLDSRPVSSLSQDQIVHSDSSSDISSSASIPPDSDITDSDSHELSSVYTPMSIDEFSDFDSSDSHISVDDESRVSGFRARLSSVLRSVSPQSEPTAVNSESSYADFSFSDTDPGSSIYSSSVSTPSHDTVDSILSNTDELSSAYTPAMSIDNLSNSSTDDDRVRDSSNSVELVSAILFCSYDVEVSGYPVGLRQFLANLPGKLMVAYQASSVYVYIGLRGSYKPLIILPAFVIDLEKSFRCTDLVLKVHQELFIGDMQGVLKSKETRLTVTFLEVEQYLAFKDALKFRTDMGITGDVSDWSVLSTFYTNLDREMTD